MLLKTGEVAFGMRYGLRQARFRPSDHPSISIDGVTFEMLNVGWPAPEAALVEAIEYSEHNRLSVIGGLALDRCSCKMKFALTREPFAFGRLALMVTALRKSHRSSSRRTDASFPIKVT